MPAFLLPPIVLAEDDPFDLELLTHSLTTQGIANPRLHFGNGVELIEFFRSHAQRHEVRLLLLDMDLPQVDGFGVIAWLRRQPAFAGLEVVVLSGSSADSDRERALALGANEFLTKPATAEALRRLVAAPSQNCRA